MNNILHLNSLHLSEEQIDDVLIGGAGAHASGHLEACGECRERVAMAAAPMASFAAVTLAWSERRSATMAVQPMHLGAAAWPYRLNWALAAVVLLAAGLLLPVSMRDAQRGDGLAVKDATPVATASVIQPQAVTLPVAAQRARLRIVSAERASNAEVARDNQMLAAIHDELDASVQSPADTFGLGAVVSRSGGGHRQNVPEPSLD